MPSQSARRFEHMLDQLFAERTHWLRSLVGKRSPGRPPIFNRKKVQRRIKQLQEHAERASVASAFRGEFRELNHPRRSWHPRAGGRRGVPTKKEGFGRFWAKKI